MKLSDAISALMALKDQHGDVHLYIESEQGDWVQEPNFDVQGGRAAERKFRRHMEGCYCMSCEDEFDVEVPWVEVW